MQFPIRLFRKTLFILGCVSFLLLSVYFSLPVVGEPPRPEKEFKISISGNLDEKIEQELYERISSAIQSEKWENDKYLSGSYYMGSELDSNYFEDIYLDTVDFLLEKNNFTHRMRYRWDSLDSLKNYRTKGILPQRLELQTKIYENDFYNNVGYKIALKNRYEIKNDYRLGIFSKWLLARNSFPWFLEAMRLTPLGNKFSPITSLEDSFKTKKIAFSYSDLTNYSYAILKRNRFHINKNTIFGYGDNKDNVFLITIDHVEAYENENYTKSLGGFTEIEIDFERNTLFYLFDAIEGVFTQHNYSKPQLDEILKSFESDQGKVKDLIIGLLQEKNIEIDTGMLTKHQKLYNIIHSP